MKRAAKAIKKKLEVEHRLGAESK
jgi:hypothetical protein